MRRGSVCAYPQPMSDARYRTVFAFPRMVEDLLRGFAAAGWAGTIDFSTLRKLSAEYVSDERLRRRGDTVWQVRLRDGRRLLVLLEFQSRDDPTMALRILAYTSLLYQELVRNEGWLADAGARLPLLLPVVVYNGATRWGAVQEVSELVEPAEGALASYRPSQRYRVLDERHSEEDDLPSPNLVTALVRLETIGSPSDLVRVAGLLRDWLRSPEDDALERVFAEWVREIAGRLVPGGARPGLEMTLEDVRMTLVERVSEWPKQWLREGREQGMREGREQGIREGREQERELLRRQATLRFGANTAAHVSNALAGVTDPERLAEVGEWLVVCGTGEELLARLDSRQDEDDGDAA